MKQVLNKEDVVKVISTLKSQGKKPTVAAIHAALDHRGSMSTLLRIKREIDAAETPTEADSSEALKAFREVWKLAVEAGLKQQEETIADLNAVIHTLTSENDRLDGHAGATDLRVKELEAQAEQNHQMLIRAQGELSEARSICDTQTKKTANALEELVRLQNDHVQQVHALQTSLEEARKSAHDFEIRYIRCLAALEAKGITSPKIEP